MTKVFAITAITAALLFILTPALWTSAQAERPKGEAEARKAADGAFGKGHWADAEKAYLAYARRMPPRRPAFTSSRWRGGHGGPFGVRWLATAFSAGACPCGA